LIIGTGIDITDITRIAIMLRRDNFLKKIYTQAEQEFLKSKKMNAQSAAGIFAVKEACSKALGTGVRNMAWTDIEVYHDSLGKPYARLHNNAQTLFEELGGRKIHISISHERFFAVAQCVLEGEEQNEKPCERQRDERAGKL